MKIFIGADHRGFKLKETLREWLQEKKYKVEDMGAYEHDEHDDYTLYAEKVGVVVADQERSRGILLCGSGVGVDVTANKIDGVRAAIGKSADQIKAGRADDNMNVLVIAADFTSEEESIKMVDAFLKTKFSGKSRHKRRLMDIERIEANN